MGEAIGEAYQATSPVTASIIAHGERSSCSWRTARYLGDAVAEGWLADPEGFVVGVDGLQVDWGAGAGGDEGEGGSWSLWEGVERVKDGCGEGEREDGKENGGGFVHCSS